MQLKTLLKQTIHFLQLRASFINFGEVAFVCFLFIFLLVVVVDGECDGVQ